MDTAMPLRKKRSYGFNSPICSLMIIIGGNRCALIGAKGFGREREREAKCTAVKGSFE